MWTHDVSSEQKLICRTIRHHQGTYRHYSQRGKNLQDKLSYSKHQLTTADTMNGYFLVTVIPSFDTGQLRTTLLLRIAYKTIYVSFREIDPNDRGRHATARSKPAPQKIYVRLYLSTLTKRGDMCL